MPAKRTRRSPRTFTVELLLNKRQPDDEAPDIALYSLGPDGRAEKKLAVARNGAMELQDAWDKAGANLALGPNVENVAELRDARLMAVRAAEAIPAWKKAKAIEVPHQIWPHWFWSRVCVTGEVEHCLSLPPYIDILPARSERLIIGPPALHPPYRLCRPICDGIVEIYERVCCCEHVIIVDPDDWLYDICKRFPELCPPRGFPEPDPIPDPFPGPFPGPDPVPYDLRDLDPESARRMKLAAATTDRAARQPVSRRVLDDLQAIRLLSPKESGPFLQERPHLHHLWHHCHCHMRKVGETTINPDGSFGFCYWRTGSLHGPGHGHEHCTTTYAYKVKQWIDNQWVEIYDGVAAHAYFTAEELANLESHHPLARDCAGPPEPVVDHDKPFVLLERIGGTYTHRLESPLQQAELGIDGALPVNGGLADPRPPGAGDGLFDRPWGATLALRLFVEEGMKALDAYYYRISVVAADGNGNPTAGQVPLPLSSPRSWAWIDTSAALPTVVGESLGPNSVNGENNLYRIPYWSDHAWLSNQYHQVWNTASAANGRYLVIVEIFDQGGNRLRPTGAAGAGSDRNFNYLHWADAANFDLVPFAALTHVFWTDNQPVYGDIEDLRQNHAESSEECQFLTGQGGDTFSAGFRAYHVNGPAGNSFMWDWRLRWRHGLNGAWNVLDSGTANVPAGLAGGLPQESATVSFATMLTGLQPPKCAFGADLRVRAKHTNGSRRLEEYDRWDNAAFAVEIVP